MDNWLAERCEEEDCSYEELRSFHTIYIRHDRKEILFGVKVDRMKSLFFAQVTPNGTV